MIRVKELLELEPFGEFELITGSAGLDNGVTSFAVLDYELESGDFSYFINGEFVLSSILLMRELNDRAIPAVRSLLERGISALAVRTAESAAIPAELISLCDEANVALFVFHKAFVNDIFIAANNYSKTRERHELSARKLDTLLGLPGGGSSPAALVREIDPALLPCCTAAFIIPPGSEDAGKATTLRLMERYSGTGTAGAIRTYIPYAEGLLLIFSGNDIACVCVENDAVMRAVADVGLEYSRCAIGIGGAADGYDEYDMTIAEAVRTARAVNAGMAGPEGTRILRFEDAGAFRCIGALAQDRSAGRLCRAAVATLQKYDSANSSELLETLCEYVRRRGDVRATAEKLFQHPNTIRYRLKKAALLLGITGDVYEQLFMMINVYLLSGGK